MRRGATVEYMLHESHETWPPCELVFTEVTPPSSGIAVLKYLKLVKCNILLKKQKKNNFKDMCKCVFVFVCTFLYLSVCTEILHVFNILFHGIIPPHNSLLTVIILYPSCCSTHIRIDIDMAVKGIISVFSAVSGMLPRFRANGGSQRENLALQNIQVREATPPFSCRLFSPSSQRIDP